ncbi:MAG: peptidase family protein [Planctomycetaceae bacterium]|nr:peptidase family protein [Planctomycetaceae bacterium]
MRLIPDASLRMDMPRTQRCRHQTFTPSIGAFAGLTLICLFVISGCSEGPQGTGPGHREQRLALTPSQELQVGREAYQQILEKAPVVESGPEVDRVRRVSERIAKAVQIEPLQREINLQLDGYEFEWEYNVVQDDQANAFCLPGGKIVVLTGLLQLVKSDDQLAAVIAHEVAHALAHHASERIARERTVGHGLLSLSYNRQQETEADHIGLFLMTFAGYDPDEAVEFWKEMQNAQGGHLHLPEIISDHPSDNRRMQQLQAWVGPAKAAKQALDEGRVLPISRR